MVAFTQAEYSFFHNVDELTKERLRAKQTGTLLSSSYLDSLEAAVSQIKRGTLIRPDMVAPAMQQLDEFFRENEAELALDEDGCLFSR